MHNKLQSHKGVIVKENVITKFHNNEKHEISISGVQEWVGFRKLYKLIELTFMALQEQSCFIESGSSKESSGNQPKRWCKA